ncbi:MAG: polysaccharide biosynthesis C-terminal domain-containing protein [Christensenellaceae bacterium]
MRIIFRALKPSEAETLVKLVRLFSVSAVTLSCTQTLSACLTGIGKPTFAAVSMAVAVAVKTILNFALVSSPKISVYGAAIAADVCYLVAFALDLVYNLIVTKRKKGDGKHDHGSRTGRGSGGFDGAGQAGDPVGKEGGGADGADPLV